MALSETTFFKELDTTSLLRTITELNRLIDNRMYVEYWQKGIDLLCDSFGAQFASLYLLELPRDLERNVIRTGQSAAEMVNQVNLWERALDSEPVLDSGNLDGSLPDLLTYSLLNRHAICFPFVLNAIPFGSITLIWEASSPPPKRNDRADPPDCAANCWQWAAR